jgi:N6-adenosine-specific RNA methylase IME4
LDWKEKENGKRADKDAGMNKKYQVIYADPPYSYRNKRTGGSMISGAADKYPVMSLTDICSVPVPDLADKNSVLFLWATTPLLPEALQVMTAWGFKYKHSIYWRKIMSLGMGYWYRGQVEQLLVGVRGKVKAFRIQKTNIVQAKVRLHSQKPDEFYELIELTGLEPKIELFARNKRPGWSCYGDQIDSDIYLLDGEWYWL